MNRTTTTRDITRSSHRAGGSTWLIVAALGGMLACGDDAVRDGSTDVKVATDVGPVIGTEDGDPEHAGGSRSGCSGEDLLDHLCHHARPESGRRRPAHLARVVGVATERDDVRGWRGGRPARGERALRVLGFPSRRIVTPSW
jgi:hypothetical protein